MTQGAATPAAVTAVIPTIVANPDFLFEAVASALAQRDVVVEVVVVVDGPPRHPVPSGLRDDDRVRVVTVPENRGEGPARNLGVSLVRTQWTAFLDDDDVWLPQKLARQLAEMGRHLQPTIVSSRLATARDGVIEAELPTVLYGPHRDVGEYLLCADTRLRIGILQTSTLLVSTDLARRQPFATHDYFGDIDWLIHAAALHGAHIVQVPEVLSIWRLTEHGLSRSGSWRVAAAWSEANRAVATPAARAGALLTGGARKRDARLGMPLLWWHAVRVGRPRLLDLATSLYLAYLPSSLRQRIARRRRSGHSARTES